MAFRIVTGDIFQTRAQAIALGIDASGRLSTTPLFTALHDRYPVFVSECRRRGRANNLMPGSLWTWRESTPWIIGLVVQDTPQGATRIRHVEAALLNLLNSWQHERIQSLALMRLGDAQEWKDAQPVIESYLSKLALPVIIYDTYEPGIDAEAPGLD